LVGFEFLVVVTLSRPPKKRRMMADPPPVPPVAAPSIPCHFLRDLMNFLSYDDPLEVVREYLQKNLELINSHDVVG
jgi:hypothetical protein